MLPYARRVAAAAALTLMACTADTKTFDQRDVSISTRGTLGQPLSASVMGALSEGKPCSLEGGELGPYWDCNEYRPLAGKMISLTCLPTEACADIHLDGPGATFVPLNETFQVTAVGDVEGTRVEKTSTVTAALPTVTFGSFGSGPDGLPLRFFEASIVRICPVGAAVRVTATQDGVALDARAESNDPHFPCWQVATKTAGDVHAEAHLLRPDRALARKIEKLMPFSAVTRFTIHDTYCGSTGITAIPSGTGTYFLSAEVRGFTNQGSGFLPAFTSHIENSGVEVTPLATSSLHAFRFSGPPAPEAELVVEAGTASVRIPIRTQTSPCPPPTPEF